MSGIVGAGGSVGAFCFGFIFKGIPSYEKSFSIVGGIVLFSAFLTFFISIKGYATLLFGEDNPKVCRESGIILQIPTIELNPEDPTPPTELDASKATQAIYEEVAVWCVTVDFEIFVFNNVLYN